MITYTPAEIAAKIGSDEFTVQSALKQIAATKINHALLFPHTMDDNGEIVATETGIVAVAAFINQPGPKAYFLKWLSKQQQS